MALFGCSKEVDTSLPVYVTKNYYDALKENNIEAARALLINKEDLPSDGSTSFEIYNYAVSNANIDNKEAAVKTTTKNSMGEITFDTVLELKGSVWKVNMEKTMTNMMRSAINKKQVGGKIDVSISGK